MANRPINDYTILAVGSLIPNIPFAVYDEVVYTNLHEDAALYIINTPEVGGGHNVASQILNPDGTYDLVLHQIRMKNDADIGLRPSWGDVDMAELQMQADEVTMIIKRDEIYNTRLSAVSGFLGQLIFDLTATELQAYQAFSAYMGKDGLLLPLNAKGRIIGFFDSGSAPFELSIALTTDDTGYWLIGYPNPQWADFIA